MPKKTSGGKKRSVDSTGGAWSSTDHAIRKARRQRKEDAKRIEREKVSALLTRDSQEKRQSEKLRLQIKLLTKELEAQRTRLEKWDDVEEAEKARREHAEEERRQEEAQQPRKRKGRKGPESWKLKGAARPAWQVYDFDVRYVDPHIKAHEAASQKAQRIRNIFVLHKGRFGEENNPDIPQPACREFLALLMQHGLTNMHARNLKTARASLLECIELDSATAPITPARSHLMRMYMDSNRPDSARRLWESLPPDDPSVWIRYSAVLVEYVSWTILKEEGSTRETTEALLKQAVCSNVFCAYYLAFFDTFSTVMDYVEEIEEATDDDPLEQAIEYCNSEQMGAWQGTDGALQWIKQVVQRTLRSPPPAKDEKLCVADLEWQSQLAAIKESCETAQAEGTPSKNDSSDDQQSDQDAEEQEVDLLMYAGMFETAMEMLVQDGQLG